MKTTPLAFAWAHLSIAMSLFVVACGGASPTSSVAIPQNAQPATPVEAPPPPIPEDLWALVPSSAMLVADLDLARVRQWSHYSTLTRWLSQYACVQAGARTELLDRVERVVAAISLRTERDVDGLLLLRGSFSGADLAMIAAEIDGNLQPKQLGRWEAYADENDLVVLLDARTLLIAGGSWSDESLKLAAGTGGQNVREAAFVQALSSRIAGEGNVFVAMAAPAGGVARDILRDIERWGGSASAIAKGLAAAPYWGVSARFDGDSAGLHAMAIAAGGTEGNATALIEAFRSAFWQAGLFMRLIGLPPILTNASLQQAAGVATVGLQATGAEAATLLTRLEDVIKGGAPACEASASIATSPTP